MFKFIMVILLTFSSVSNAGFKGSIGPEFNSTQTTIQVPYSTTQGPITENGLITVDRSSEQTFQGRVNFGYEFSIFEKLGIEPTISSTTNGKVRTELFLNDRLTKNLSLKVGPSYSIENGNPLGVSLGAELNLNEKVFIDFKGNFTQFKTRPSAGPEEHTISTTTVYTGLGFKF